MVTELVDVETSTSKKAQLDTKIISYTKRKCFELHPSNGDSKKEWNECIVSIDNEAKDMKQRLNSQK